LRKDENGSLACQNRIVRDKLIGKQVQIVKGMFKGQKGRVTQVNGEEAIVELSTRPKKVAIPKEDLRESVFEESS
jgi:transcription elongation factor SPT5